MKDDSRGFSPGRLDLKTPLILLMSMASLLVAMCAINVATLLLLRSAARAREMSMRYALGASRSRIVSRLFVEGGILGLAGAIAVLREMVLIATVATLLALPSIALLTRYFRSQLYGVIVYDPVTLAATTALIVIMVLVAAALPARRAAGVQPMRALRTE